MPGGNGPIAPRSPGRACHTWPVVSLVEFNPLSPGFFADPYDTYRRLRDEAPVYVDERFGGPCVSRR